MRILQHHAQRTSQIILFNLIDIDIIIADLPIINIVEPVNQVGDRRLACPGRSDKRNLLPRFREQRNVMQHLFVRIIAKVHMIHHEFPLKRDVIRRTVRLMIMLPGPPAGLLRRLGNVAVLINLRVDQGYISIVFFRLFVDEIKDSLRAGKRHDNRVQLGRHLVDRHGK